MSIAPFAVQRDSSAPSVAIVRLEQPGKPVVVLDRGLIERLEATLRALPTGLTGLVLASASERVFVAGADLKSIQELDDAGLHEYLEYGARVFGMLAQLPFPTLAAINGAALGGGLELAMHCDGLVAAPSASGKAYSVGLPEAGLSICPGWGGTNLLPARMEPGEAIRRTATGQPMTFDEAKAAGLFDAAAGSAAELIPACLAWLGSARAPQRDGAPLRWIGRATGKGSPAETVNALVRVRPELPSTDSARAVADAVDAGLTHGWQAALKVERERLVHLRNTPAGRAAIQAFFAKAAGKG
jgi:enoyl-CoA hydratase/carnithine racemase